MNDRLRELGATGIAAQALPGELAVRVDGVLAADDVGRWRAAQEWFDSRYGGRVALWAKFGEPAAAIQLPFVIRSIWMEPRPAVQTDDGARRGVGDVLPGGWAISSIEQGALTIARDGQSLTIRY